jgi:hypothetical protein
MDNGAHVSVLSRKLVDSLSPRPMLIKEHGRRLVTFTKTRIPIDGVVKLPVKYGSVSIPSFEFFVVPKGSPVMGTRVPISSMHLASKCSTL